MVAVACLVEWDEVRWRENVFIGYLLALSRNENDP